MKRTAPKLRTRIGLYFLGLLVMWTLLVSVLLGSLLSQSAHQVFRERGAQVARRTALECAPLVYYEDVAAIAQHLRTLTAPPSDVRYAIIIGEDDQVFASTFPRGVPDALLRLQHGERLADNLKAQIVETPEELIYDYETEEAGVRVRVGVSLRPVQALVQSITGYILWIGVAGMLGAFAIALHVSRPVEALATAFTRAVDLDPHIRASSALYGTLETSNLAEWFQELITRLQESTKRLEGSQKLAYLGEISASIAHEINNPLGIIVLNSEFLAKRADAGTLDPDAAAEVGRVRTAALRATLAAQKLLQFARYSTQRTPATRRRTRVGPIIHETVELLRDRFQLSGCTVRIELPDDLPAVSLDQQGIQQVLFNLLTNAIDASPNGGEIVISASVDEHEFVLAVRDHGEGMSEELVKTVKQPFISTKEPGGGTGLGLAISDSIVQTHGGRLVIDSKVGEGTTMAVHLPLRPTP
jgi:signal transduction histidine kinase